MSELELLLTNIETKIRHELRIRCEACKADFKTPEVFSVTTALLARQATLAIDLASAPQLWNGHSAPLFLRAMTDVHITMSWILLDPAPRAKQYIEFGLGQAVLLMEHRKKSEQPDDTDSRAQMETLLEAEEGWINSQRWSFLVQVNVGAWSGKNTREMAEEAGILDFYNHVYIPFSQCAHSSWYHVGRYNSRPSDSPLTRLLWTPTILDERPDTWNLYLAAKYLDKTFNVFDQKALGRSPSSNIRDWIDEEIQRRVAAKHSSEENRRQGL